MKLRLLYHGHCFDGVASAAVFTRFYKERIHPEAEVSYGGLLHRPGNLFDLNLFDGDENAIVDFKYAASEKLTWWFDHHQSAFLTAEDEAHFRKDTSGKKFLDATRKSCTEFIADIAHSQFGYDDAPDQVSGKLGPHHRRSFVRIGSAMRRTERAGAAIDAGDRSRSRRQLC